MQAQYRYIEQNECGRNGVDVMGAWAQQRPVIVDYEEMIVLVRKAVYPKVLRLRYGEDVFLNYHDDHCWAYQALAEMRGDSTT